MITLYHCISARSLRALWMLEDVGLPYTLRMLPFPPRALARDYLALNPLGTVPLLIDGDIQLTESAAICQYLAERHAPHRLHVTPDDPQRAAYLNWLHMSDATLTFPQTLVLRYGRLEPAERRQPQIVTDYARWFLGRLRAVDAAVTRHPFLCGQRFTAADVAVGYALLLAQHLALDRQFTPAVQDYWQRLRSRDALQRALAAERAAALAQGVDPRPAPETMPE